MSYDLILRQALKLHDEGRLDEAERLYRQILETAPDHPVVLNLLGLVAQSKGLHEQAVSFFARAVEQNPQSAEYHFNLAWSEERRGKAAEAIKAYLRALQLQPGIKEARNALGNLYAGLGQTERAREQYNQAALLDPAYAEPRANLAKAENDIPALQKLAAQYPDDALIPYYISLLYRKEGKNEQALAAAERACALSADESALLLAGELCLDMKRQTEALGYFRRALGLNARSVTALINLANAEADAETAEQMYKKALDISPGNVDARINLADLFHRQGRLHEALEEYRQAVILAPERAEISNNLGIIQKNFGEYEEALGLFFNALLKRPERAEYALNAAETLTLLYEKEADKAKKITANWLRQMPENIFARRLNEIFGHTDGSSGTDYARELFNQFAGNYETVMNKIEYRLPLLFKQLLGAAKGEIIDLGCGTGLIGRALKNDENRLTGVDISSAMLEQAGKKGVYDKLVEADIEKYCRRLPPADWVVAADVFGYVGRLDGIIPAVFPRNFCFSVAAAAGTDDYELTPSGRYRHNPEYVKKLLQKAGYSDIMEHRTELRRENGRPVEGIVFVAKEK